MIPIPDLINKKVVPQTVLRDSNDVFLAYANLTQQKRQQAIENKMKRDIMFLKLGETNDPIATRSAENKKILTNALTEHKNWLTSYYRDNADPKTGIIDTDKYVPITEASNRLNQLNATIGENERIASEITQEYMKNQDKYDPDNYASGMSIFQETGIAPPDWLQPKTVPITTWLEKLKVTGTQQENTSGYKSDTGSSSQTTEGYSKQDRQNTLLMNLSSNPEFASSFLKEFKLQDPSIQNQYIQKAKSEGDIGKAYMEWAIDNFWDKFDTESESVSTENIVDTSTKNKNGIWIGRNGYSVDGIEIAPVEKDWMGMHFGNWLNYNTVNQNLRTFNYGDIVNPEIVDYNSQTGVGSTKKLTQQQEKTYASQDLMVYATDTGLGKIILSTNNPSETDRKYFIVPLKGNESLLSKMGTLDTENMGNVKDYNVTGSFYEGEIREKYNKSGGNYNDPIEKIQEAYPKAKIISDEPGKTTYKNITKNVFDQKTMSRSQIKANYKLNSEQEIDTYANYLKGQGYTITP